MSMWFLFIGIFFLFTGFGAPIGILLLVLFFLTEMRNSNPTKQYNENTFNIDFMAFNLNLLFKIIEARIFEIPLHLIPSKSILPKVFLCTSSCIRYL